MSSLNPSLDPDCPLHGDDAISFGFDHPLPHAQVQDLLDVEGFRQRVVYEDNHLLVVDKPVCLASQGAGSGEESLFTLAQRYIKRRYNKPGAVYLGVVSRLDFPVSGVVVFARTSKSAGRLSEQFRTHTVRKFYQAYLEGKPRVADGELVDFICEDKNTRRLWITHSQKTDARFSPKESRLSFRTLESSASKTRVEIELFTGRKHQIRLQFAAQGSPIVGDGKYGAVVQSRPGICLHACKLVFRHPTTKQLMEFSSLPPNWSKMKWHS